MYATLTLYRVNPIFKDEFLGIWEELLAKFQNTGLAVSGMIHRETRISYVDYVQWQNKADFEKVHNDELPQLSQQISKLHSYCNNVQLLHRMEVINQNSPSPS